MPSSERAAKQVPPLDGNGLPPKVAIVEVAPRDGLQSHPVVVETGEKVQLIEDLADAGLKKIEITAFARPDVIPQLADADELVRRVARRPGVMYRALCPNLRGAERALGAGVDEVLGLITVSETYSRKNANMMVKDAIDGLRAIAKLCEGARTTLSVALGVCTFCPYEGEIPVAKVLEVIASLSDFGIDECVVATSAGLDGPGRVARLLEAIRASAPQMHLAIHLHDTNGMALANAIVALQSGIDTFEAAICGLGGGIRMPRALPHCGNVATEDLVAMLHDLGVDCGLQPSTIVDVAERAKEGLKLNATWSHALACRTAGGVVGRSDEAAAR